MILHEILIDGFELGNVIFCGTRPGNGDTGQLIEFLLFRQDPRSFEYPTVREIAAFLRR